MTIDSTKPLSVQIDNIVTDLNNKADRDLVNVVNSAKSKCAGWSMPSTTSIPLTLGANGTTYTAPANGFFDLRKGGQAGEYVRLNGTLEIGTSLGSTTILSLFLPVRKGETLTLRYSLTGTTYVWRFVYAQGSESEE